MRRRFARIAALIVACSLSCATRAEVVWDEGVQGELSNSGLAPTVLSFLAGTNRISGVVGNGGQGIDRDYFTFTVPIAGALTAIRFIADETFPSGSVSFIALQAGPQVTVGTEGQGMSAWIGGFHFGNDALGQNILPALAGGSLQPGAYSVWIQETGGPAPYAVEFDMTAPPVPLPAGFVLLASGLAGLQVLRRRRSIVVRLSHH